MLQAFNKAAGSCKVPVADMAGQADVLAAAVREAIASDIGQLGLALTSFLIESITLQNYRGHRDTTVPCQRLTMLVGENATPTTGPS